jgi:hypothetical protein
MRLWTYHRDGFSPVIGPVKPELSRYALKYPAQYAQLWRRLGTNQLIWCVTDPSDWPIKSGHTEWELDASESSFLAVLDSLVWEGILGTGIKCWPSLERKLRSEARANPRIRTLSQEDTFIDARFNQLVHPPGDPWDHLFMLNCVDPCVLLPCPIPADWLIGSQAC